MITEASYPGSKGTATDAATAAPAPAGAELSGGNVYIGLMSGTSLDGVDGVLALLPPSEPPTASSPLQPLRPSAQSTLKALAHAHIPFPAGLRDALLALQTAGPDEIHREALAANQLMLCYAACIADLRRQRPDAAPVAIGAHGQTVRHRPDIGYTRQINNPALLAELAGIDVIADFRSRDVAAGGQGAPLVPAFHQAAFGHATQTRVVVNIGGIGNISVLPPSGDGDATGNAKIIGFDTGPGNVLMDGWITRHRQQAYDDNGDWAASGTVHGALLQLLLDEPYFALPAPKSTGRDLFHMLWLDEKLSKLAGLAQSSAYAVAADISPADVQATLAALAAYSIAAAIRQHAPGATDIYVCGGGAYNGHLLQLLRTALAGAAIHTTDALGIPPNQVEAMAFAWLAQRFTEWLPGNIPTVTGAGGWRLLGALYPA